MASFWINDVEFSAEVGRAGDGTLAQDVRVRVSGDGFVEVDGRPVGWIADGAGTDALAIVTALLARGVFRTHADRARADRARAGTERLPEWAGFPVD